MLSVGVQCNLLKPFLHSSPCISESELEGDDFEPSDTSYEPDEESDVQDDLDDSYDKSVTWVALFMF